LLLAVNFHRKVSTK